MTGTLLRGLLCGLAVAIGVPEMGRAADPFESAPGPTAVPEPAVPQPAAPRPRPARPHPSRDAVPFEQPSAPVTSPPQAARPAPSAEPPASVIALPPSIPALPPAGSTGYASEAQDFAVPPQNSLRTGQIHAPTPLFVPGARTITTGELYSRLAARQPVVLIYVNEDQVGIAGAHWLDGAGRGAAFGDVIEQRLGSKLRELTGGNQNANIVVFCYDSHCWLSYNATLRLVRLGYRNVSWYRGGKQAWAAAGLPLTTLARDVW